MVSSGGGGRTAPVEEAQDDARRQVINYYDHRQVNSIGTVHNAIFGDNHGAVSQNQNTANSATPTAFVNATRVAGPVTDGSPVPNTPTVPNWTSNLTAQLNPIPDASHTRDRKRSPPNSACFPGTRKRVIRRILSWVNSSLLLGNPHIMWVYGYAGCGKSAIAQAVAELLAGQRRLAASFFFFRGTADRSRTARFATSVAHQIAAAIPATAPLIEAAIRANPALVTSDTDLSAQFEYLVYGPIDNVKWDRLAASLRHGPYLILLDGLDECADHDEVAVFIGRMIAFFERKPFIPLRFLITSRVENHIHNRLYSSKQVSLLNLVRNTTNADILTAFEAAIQQERQGLVLACADSWPSVEEKAKLVEHIGGSFIFLTTIVKLLFDPYTKDNLTPMERLPLILSMQPDFDGLYRAILEPSQDLPYFQDIVSAIALAQEPLTITQIAELLSIMPTKVANVLITLHSIMQVPGDDRTPVTLWHTSLRDFLCTRARAGIFLADCRSMAYSCLSAIYRSTTLVSSLISDYAYRFALFHWEEYCIAGSREDAEGRAAEQEVTEFLKYLSANGCTPLEAAAHSKSWTVVGALVAANADINVRFKQHRDGVVCALHAACYHEQWDLIYLLLEKGADPNIFSTKEDYGGCFHGTPLTFAARKGDVKLATRLLECGADPNLQGSLFGTALHAACVSDSLEVVNLLLDHGADTDLRYAHGRTSSLHTCAFRGNDSCARALLMHQADPNVQDNDGDTPLHIACRWEAINVVECLLKFKVDTRIRNNEGRTAMQVADDLGNNGVIQAMYRYQTLE